MFSGTELWVLPSSELLKDVPGGYAASQSRLSSWWEGQEEEQERSAWDNEPGGLASYCCRKCCFATPAPWETSWMNSVHWPEAATNTVESVLVFGETWFSRDIPDNFTQVDRFSHVRLDRDENLGKTRGGGVCIYIKDSWCERWEEWQTWRQKGSPCLLRMKF